MSTFPSNILRKGISSAYLTLIPLHKKYTADLILRTKFKRIIGIKVKVSQNVEVPVSLTEFLLGIQGSFGGFLFV